jgi:hypothetical protein
LSKIKREITIVNSLIQDIENATMVTWGGVGISGSRVFMGGNISASPGVGRG